MISYKNHNLKGNKIMATKNAASNAVDETTGAVKFDSKSVKIKRAVTLPVLSQKGQKTIYAFIAATIQEKQHEEEGEMKTVHTVTVVDMETVLPHTVVLSAVQLGTLREEYPDDTYLYKCFMFENLGKLNGKRYNTSHISEIDDQGVDYKGIARNFGVLKIPTLKELTAE